MSLCLLFDVVALVVGQPQWRLGLGIIAAAVGSVVLSGFTVKRVAP